MFYINKNMIALSLLIDGLVGDVSYLREFMKIKDLYSLKNRSCDFVNARITETNLLSRLILMLACL